ncbi:hypothetical protein Q8A67_024688 [Cirrhinus molitorella]|uniref:Uncharacterized protein n=1 Tax=Cirrhinus molitorella TaxID=172907 RepID=A0AA88P4Q0_9TELE|nr:hypothetical protein Q8A67_024688 [Cirrhinus molitorella]
MSWEASHYEVKGGTALVPWSETLHTRLLQMCSAPAPVRMCQIPLGVCKVCMEIHSRTCRNTQVDIAIRNIKADVLRQVFSSGCAPLTRR